MTVENDINEYLKTSYLGKNFKWFDRISSTNDYLKEEAQNLCDGYCVATTEQFAGKGRRGHTWISSKGQIVAFSFLLNNSFHVNLPPITLMCGLAVTKALNNLTQKKFQIKWPNDVVYQGKKICGILCESKIDRKNCFSVCGIGINLLQTEDFFKESNLAHGTSLLMINGSSPAKEQVVAEVLNQFELIYESLKIGDDASINNFLNEYQNNCVTINKDVKIIKTDSEIYGKALKINRDGSLCVESDGKLIDVMASEASVRGVMGYL